MRKRKKRAMTLLEVMIVIFIIGIISSVIGYNMRGSMDQGKAFKTKEAMTKVYNIVQLEMSSEDLKDLDKKESEAIKETVLKVLEGTNLLHKPNQYLVDGWKDPFEFKVKQVNGQYEIRITSTKYTNFYKKKGQTPEYPWN